ncbi:MAG: GNAT family N-acetyltransferase [Mariprofundaceae bacterium]|nr:GNAT family N-acetyltransferase [Mariprofundaceae bacterium]
MFVIDKYLGSNKVLWNDFVAKAKNSHFFFHRDYMEYHADRFEDHSLMVYNDKNKLIALLPANVKGGVLYSHQGLTFGGLLTDASMRTEMVLDIFESIQHYCRELGVLKLVYKCIPHIYHRIPSEEDRYALFRMGAQLVRRDVSASINLMEVVRYSKGRKWTVNKSKKEGLTVQESQDLSSFWTLLDDTIMKQHAAKPVHTLEEMEGLLGRFPDHIRLFTVHKDEQLVAGSLMYENQHIVHTQYLANSDEGRDLGALDFLLDYLIKDKYKDKRWFDFGISNEEQGRVLNAGLMAQKEGFGARAVVHDFYELDMSGE